MSNILVAMQRIILSLDIQQHDKLKTEVKEVQSFINARRTTSRGNWWEDEEKRTEARKKMAEASTKRWGYIKISWRSTGLSMHVRNYREAAPHAQKSVHALAAMMNKAGDNPVSIRVDDDVVVLERVRCVQN